MFSVAALLLLIAVLLLLLVVVLLPPSVALPLLPVEVTNSSVASRSSVVSLVRPTTLSSL